jgi:Domain of unknown function (DUF5134)
MTPAWIPDVFAGVMLTVAVVSASRLVARLLPGHGLPVTDALASPPLQRGSRDAGLDAAQALMGIAMAGMLATALQTLPTPAWVMVFAVLGAWFAWRLLDHAMANGLRSLVTGRCGVHLLHSVAMVYMFADQATSGGMAMTGMPVGMDPAARADGMQPLQYPAVSLFFALVIACQSVWDVDRLSRRRYSFGSAASGKASVTGTTCLCPEFPTGNVGGSNPKAPGRSALLSPAATVTCRIAMGATMTFMLLSMI